MPGRHPRRRRRAAERWRRRGSSPRRPGSPPRRSTSWPPTTSAPGLTDETIVLYLATGLTEVPTDRHGPEEHAMTVERIPLDARARHGRGRSHHRRQDDHRAHAHVPTPVMVASRVAEARATRTTPCPSRSRTSSSGCRPSGAARPAPSPPTGATCAPTWPGCASRGTTLDRRRPRTTCRRTSPSSAAASWRRPRWPARWCRCEPSTASSPTRAARPTDPGAHLELPRVPQGLPKALTEEEVGRLLDAPVGEGPVGAARPGHARGALRHRRARLGAGRALHSATSTSTPPCCGPSARGARSGSCRSASRPSGRWSRGSGPRAGRRWRPSSGGGAATPRRCSSTRAAVACRRQGAWDVLRRYAPAVGPRGQAHPPRAAPLLRHPHARPRGRHPGRAGAARARLDQHHAGVHAGLHRAAVGRVPERPPTGATRAVAWPDA